ncbi:MAG: porin [Pseudomonadota bacterium]
MKRLSLKACCAAAIACCAALPAHAQSNVTIYGRLNLSLERQKLNNGDSLSVLQNNASRIGFKGTEDLGDGMFAGFQLEHGFSADTGAQTQTSFWARQSEVHLGSKRAGMLRLGNFTSEAYYATADYVSMHNHDTGTSSDAFYAYIGRNGNKVAYRTPDMGGFTAEAAVTAGEGAGERTYDLAVNGTVGPVQLGAGYEKNGDANQFAVRALYEIGAFVVGGYVQRDENAYGAGKRTTTRLAGMYNLGSTELHLNWGHAGKYSDVAGDSSANQYTLGVNHNLSKRTKVYGFYTKVTDKGTIYGDFSSIALGLRHNF